MKPKDILNSIHEGYAKIEGNDVSGACRICLRISRGLNDYMAMAFFLRETSPTKQLFSESFFNLTTSLKDDARKYL